MMGFASLYPSYESGGKLVTHASPATRKVIRVNSDGRPSRKAKPGHSAVPLLT